MQFCDDKENEVSEDEYCSHYKKKIYRYYSILRPVAPGTFPNKGTLIRIVNFDGGTMIDSIGKMAWGYIEYSYPLTEKDIENYELVQED